MDIITDIFNILASIALQGLELALNYPAYSIPAFIFLILAAYWRQTGRFPAIGFLVRLLYIPINLLALSLWVVFGFLNGLSKALCSWQSFSGVLLFVLILLTLKDIGYFFSIPAFLLLLRFRVDTTTLSGLVTYYPRAKRQAEPRPVKPPRPVKAAAPTFPGKPAQPAAPPPVVQVAASVSGSQRKASQLISELPPHLQALIAGAGAEAEAEATERRKVPLLKLVLRSLLLLPFWLLLTLIKPFKRGRKPQAEGEAQTTAEAEAEAIPDPITSEASGSE